MSSSGSRKFSARPWGCGEGGKVTIRFELRAGDFNTKGGFGVFGNNNTERPGFCEEAGA